MRCSGCGAEIDAGAKFCPQCATATAQEAPSTAPGQPAPTHPHHVARTIATASVVAAASLAEGIGACAGCGALLSPGLLTCPQCGWMAGVAGAAGSGEEDHPMTPAARKTLETVQVKVIGVCLVGVAVMVGVLLLLSHT
jgi:RNA polymerase subunit RPABC4/transcription elongation factor Spt4